MSAQDQTHAADRIYYDAQGDTEFTATVTAIREVARLDGRQVWQLALDRTAFYPESGGQPFDTGMLVATARSGTSLQVPITDVQEDEAGEVWHTTAKPLQEGTVVRGVVDAQRRRDHMQQHSGQHLLSALLLRDLGLKTVSFHLGQELCTIDLEGGTLTEDDFAAVELAVSHAVAQALPVEVSYVSRAEAEAMLRDGTLRKLPPRQGTIRLVTIPGIDWNACGGTHVATTADIGPVLLRATERVRGTVRLHFLCGDRALRAAYVDYQRLTALARTLSTNPADMEDAVRRLQAENRAAAKEGSALLQQLAVAEAAALTAGAVTTFFMHTLNPQLPGRGAEYAKLLATALVTASQTHRALVCLPQESSCSVALAARPGTGNCGAELRSALQSLGGRGGGGAELAQGNLPASELATLVDLLQRAGLTG